MQGHVRLSKKEIETAIRNHVNREFGTSYKIAEIVIGHTQTKSNRSKRTHCIQFIETPEVEARLTLLDRKRRPIEPDEDED